MNKKRASKNSYTYPDFEFPHETSTACTAYLLLLLREHASFPIIEMKEYYLQIEIKEETLRIPIQRKF